MAGGNSANAEFCVINGKGEPLLGRETATDLGVLKIGLEVAAVYASSKNIGEILQKKIPRSQWFWKAKRPSGQTPHRPNVTPVAQPIRRTPFSLRSKVEAKIQELILTS